MKYEQEQGLFSGSACVGIDKGPLLARWGDSLAGWVAAQDSCKIINDIQHTPQFPDELADALAESSFLTTPLQHDNKLLGVLVLAGKKDASEFDTKDRQRLIYITSLISWTINYLTTTPTPQVTHHYHAAADIEETPAQDRLASIGELTAGIAHELRNPLAGIMTTAETLNENFEPGDPRKEYLDRIINEINRMNQFLIRFFAFARPSKPQKQACRLPQIIDRIIDLEAQNIHRNNISVIKEYQPSLPDIELDANQMQQVFLNLILNSVQAMPDGGELKISIRADNGQNKRESSGYLQVDISDTGVGIKPQDLNKIFTPFHTTKPRGIGLGLAVSRRILDEHKGMAWVTSKVGEGTTFSIKLPLGT